MALNIKNIPICSDSDSDLSLQESSQQVEADETRPVCVSERAKRFGGEDRRRKPHQPQKHVHPTLV